MGWDGMGWDGMGGLGWDGMGWDGKGWDGTTDQAIKVRRNKTNVRIVSNLCMAIFAS
jgi:hypothetical protein